MTTTVSSLAALVGGRVIGDGERPILGVADLRGAGPDRIGFVRDQKYRAAALETRAGALITFEEIPSAAAQIVVADVSVAYAKVALHFHPLPRATRHEVHASAQVHPDAELEAPVHVGPNAVIGRCRLGAGTVIMTGVVVEDGCRIGRDCVLHPRVVLYHHVEVGDRVVVHAGTVLGSDGFGYAREGATFVKVPQLGALRIRDDVEIGANCTIDRGAMGNTEIGARTKIDNLCHFAHNVVVGEDCAFAAATFVAGSTRLGDRVIMAGHAAVAGHLKIHDDVRVGGNSCILRDIDEAGDYMGHPLMPKVGFIRVMTTLRGLVERLAGLERRTRHLVERDDGRRQGAGSGAGSSGAGSSGVGSAADGVDD